MISLNWVKDYIDLEGEDLQKLAVEITKAGVNVEKVVTNHIPNLVIGQVLSCKPHPDSDHLKVCQVDIGKETIQIVCGAPNVREGLKVIVSLPGAILPGDFEIKKGVIRGMESNGMICALFELGLEEKNEENYAKGIHELELDAPVGEDPLKYLGLDDTLYELDIHKHRNNDCTNHIGFAYEIASILGKKVTLPPDDFHTIQENIKDYFTLRVETDKCPYYNAMMVKDVEIKESPDFIKKRLVAAGMRSINNVVDISNYVMLEYGQPMHFFDKDKLGDQVVVRMAKDQEELVTLDGIKRVLKDTDIVITDGKKPVCIAGVMGGENTEVDENTKTILIESAIFDPVSIRYTSTNLDLKSEASMRYGKGLNFENTDRAIKRACYLLEKYANGKVLQGMIQHDKVDKTIKKVSFKKEEINKLLGIDISTESIKEQFKKLYFDYEYDDGIFTVTIPRRRIDIEPRVNDITEEIGRLYGYHNLASTLPIGTTKKGIYVGDVGLRKACSKRLRALGLNEVKTYTLVSEDMAKLFNYENKKSILVPNPMSMDKSVIRKTLLSSLMNTYMYNRKRKVQDISIYEISKVYSDEYIEGTKVAGLLFGNYLINDWQGSKKIDFYVVKGIIENLLDYLGFRNRYHFETINLNELHPGMSAKILLDKEEIGLLGRLHPNLCKEEVYVFELSMEKLNKNTKPLKFKEVSKYPVIVKDVAFIVDENIPSNLVTDLVKKAGGRLLNDFTIFDVYTGENVDKNKKSIAYKLTFSSTERTLTEEEVMTTFNKIIHQVTTELKADIRDK